MRNFLKEVTSKYFVMIAIFVIGISVEAGACTVVMGYKSKPKLPLIAENPDSSGVYNELYSRAAKKINCKLKVVRLPKKRAHVYLQKGVEIDFYPGMKFSKKRANYSYFIPNGLPGGRVGITLASFPEITDLKQLRGKTILVSLDSSYTEVISGIGGIKLHKIPKMGIEKAIKMIRLKRGDFYSTEPIAVEYFLKSRGIIDFKIQRNCCGGHTPIYMGFSRKSPLFRESSNPNYDKSKPISPENFPTIVNPDTIPHKLGLALREMEESGETEMLYQSYLIKR